MACPALDGRSTSEALNSGSNPCKIGRANSSEFPRSSFYRSGCEKRILQNPNPSTALIARQANSTRRVLGPQIYPDSRRCLLRVQFRPEDVQQRSEFAMEGAFYIIFICGNLRASAGPPHHGVPRTTLIVPSAASRVVSHDKPGPSVGRLRVVNFPL